MIMERSTAGRKKIPTAQPQFGPLSPDPSPQGSLLPKAVDKLTYVTQPNSPILLVSNKNLATYSTINTFLEFARKQKLKISKIEIEN